MAAVPKYVSYKALTPQPGPTALHKLCDPTKSSKNYVCYEGLLFSPYAFSRPLALPFAVGGNLCLS